MANKDVQESIAKLVRERPRQLLDIVDGEIAQQQNFSTAREALCQGLRFLMGDLRHQAELVMDSGARGKGAEATALRSVASHLSLLADAVEKVDLDATGEPAPSRGGPKLPAEWCRKTDEHGPHDYPVPDGEGGDRYGYKHCTGHHPRDASGLNALVAERAAKHAELDAFGVPDFRGPGDLADPNVGAFAFAAPAPPEEDLGVFGVNERDAPHTMTVERVPVPDYLLRPNPELEAYIRGDDVAPIEPTRINTPELKAEAATMFAAPTPPSRPAEPELPGRRLTFAELLKPPPVAPPEHMSYSQITGMSCGTQYRLSRLEPGVVERPRWANVGGTALHSAVEWFEKQVAKAPGNAEYARSRIEIAGGIAGIWVDNFGQAVTNQSLATPTVSPGQWKESGRHVKEGYTWWLTQGEDMLRRYLDGRLVEIANEGRVMGSISNDPLIEHEGILDVDGVSVKVVLDQVWWGEPGVAIIEDLKSGGWAPDGTFQLGLYAWYLRKTLGWEGQILGRFWDARKGTYGEPVDLIETHPWEEVQLRVLPEARKKEAGLFSPNPSFGGCKSCMVSHACPAAKVTS
jgi:hypothetical protein